jgi:hypothetical protein
LRAGYSRRGNGVANPPRSPFAKGGGLRPPHPRPRPQGGEECLCKSRGEDAAPTDIYGGLRSQTESTTRTCTNHDGMGAECFLLLGVFSCCLPVPGRRAPRANAGLFGSRYQCAYRCLMPHGTDRLVSSGRNQRQDSRSLVTVSRESMPIRHIPRNTRSGEGHARPTISDGDSARVQISSDLCVGRSDCCGSASLDPPYNPLRD